MANLDIVAHAREYDARAWALIALPYGSKKPVDRGWQTNLVTADDFEQMMAHGQQYGIGLMTGAPSNNLCRVDLDHPAAVLAAPLGLPPTELIMGRDGNPYSGYFYQVLDGLSGSITYKDPTSTGDEATIIDVLWTGKMTVVPPSVHPSGGHYGWHVFRQPARISADEFLQQLNEFYAAVLIGIHWPEGARHDAALAVAGGLASDGWEQDKVDRFIRVICAAAQDTEVEDRLRSVQDTFDGIQQGKLTVGWTRLADSVDRRAIRRVREVLGLAKRAAAARISAAGDLRTTDLGNAQRMADQTANELRYCHPMKKWFYWSGVKWQEDMQAMAGRRAFEVVQGIYKEAADADTRDARATLSEWAVASESVGHINGMMSLAKQMPGLVILPDEMDTDPWLLNMPNGTVDLRTMKLTPHNQQDLITKVTGAPWETEAPCPRWEKFLSEVFDFDREIIDYVQRVVGYCLTGTTREQCIFILWGDGANGKSTFLYVLDHILGDYGANTPFDTFDSLKQSTTGNELARLKGKRFVTAIEAEHERTLAESRVKAVTGGDKITCRFLYGEHFEYYPEFKIHLAVNYKPIIRGTDHGIWRRIAMLPFTKQFKGAADIKGLREAIVALELPGATAWALEGVRKYLEVGLNTPARLIEATGSYRVEMDIMAQFLEENTEDVEKSWVSSKDLYSRYTYWNKDYGEKALTHRSFGLELSRRGYDKVKSNSQIRWRGLRLKPEVFSPAGLQEYTAGGTSVS